MYPIRIVLLALPVLWATLGACANPTPVVAPANPAVTADNALKSLTAGNARFVSGNSSDLHRDQNRRCETVTGGQHPIAAILACADSRAPVELLFDQGIGDLFVIRVAGNVADTSEVGTLEYGVGHLGIPLIVVLGHSNCGAVTAAVEKAEVHGSVAGLLAHITPAAEKARAQQPDAKTPVLVTSAIRLNVWQSIEDICGRSDTIRDAVKAGRVKIVGGIYDIHNGAVEILGPHPQQDQLLSGQFKPASQTAVRPSVPAAEGTPAKPADPAPAKSAEVGPAKPGDHAPAGPADHGPAPAKPANPAGHSQETHELIHEVASPTQAAAPTTRPAEEGVVSGKKTRTFALAGLITGSAVLSLLVVHIVRTHK